MCSISTYLSNFPLNRDQSYTCANLIANLVGYCLMVHCIELEVSVIGRVSLMEVPLYCNIVFIVISICYAHLIYTMKYNIL